MPKKLLKKEKKAIIREKRLIKAGTQIYKRTQSCKRM